MAVDASGRILVADTEAGRVLVVEEVDGPSLITPGACDDVAPETRFVSPFVLATDADGLLYMLDPVPGHIVMTEPEEGRVVMLDQAGSALRSWRLPGGDDFAAKPVGVAVDAQGGVWVADSGLGRLVRLE